MGWTFYNASGEALTNFGPVALTDLDIAGGTDVGEAIVAADLFIIDNGAGGTNVKTAASRIATYIEGAFTAGANVDLGSSLLVGNGGSTGIAISSAGEVTMAAQPAFLAFNSANDLNVTGNGAVATLDFDTEVFDQNADFASDTFTAPVTGRYLMTFHTRVFGVTAAADTINVNITSSNRNYRLRIDDTNDLRGNCSYVQTSIIDMDASDTATATIQITGESSDVNDVTGGSETADGTVFSGILLA